MTSRQRVVVAGGGMAGARLAQQTAGAGVDLTVVGEEPHGPYNRVLLGEVLAGRYTSDVVRLPPYPAEVRTLHGVRAVRIDRGDRVLVCDDGSRLPYDRLVLATGANPVLPPLRGLFSQDSTASQGSTASQAGTELPDGVLPFRTMDDCLALGAQAREGVRAVVIGGGLLGVSAARALAQRGVQVLLAHQGERLMERQLDAEAAEVLRRHMTDLGVEVHTECRVRGVRTDGAHGAARTVRAVELADGCTLDAGLVVLSCGTRPRTGLARAAGLRVERGVVVDDSLRTSDPHIHAIGDCAEHNGVLYGRAGPAQEQADILAAVLTRPAPPRYRGTRALTRLTLASGGPSGQLPLDLASFGETSPLPDDDVVRLADATRGRYRKVVVRGDRLVGGILLGDLGTVGALARTWEGDEPLPSAPLHHLLTNDGG